MAASYVLQTRDRISSAEFSQLEVWLIVPHLVRYHEQSSKALKDMSNQQIASDPSAFNIRVNAWDLLALLADRSAMAQAYLRRRCESGEVWDDEKFACR